MRLERIRRRYSTRVALEWRPFALRPDEPAEGFEFAGSYVERGWRSAALMTRADGIAYRPWERGPLPRWSLPGLIAASAAGRQGEEAFRRFHLLMFEAFFTRNEDISQAETAFDVARRARLDLEAFSRAIGDPELRSAVRAKAYEAAVSFRVSAVPSVVIGGRFTLRGAVAESEYLKALAECGLDVPEGEFRADAAPLASGWVGLGDVEGNLPG